MFNFKAIKVCWVVRCASIITINEQSYPKLSIYTHQFIAYVPYFILDKFLGFVLIILLYFKILACSNQTFTFSNRAFTCSHRSLIFFLNIYLLLNRSPNKFQRNAPFASFSIVLLILFINKPASSRDLTIFMILFIYSFGIIRVVIPYREIFFWRASSVTNTAAVNPYGMKTLLANVLSKFLLRENQF